MTNVGLQSNIISLCSGVEGLGLGVHRAIARLGGTCRTVAYVEREAFACAVLASRMAEGALDAAPIWSDLATFDARPLAGLPGLGVVAGVPCQPHSHAGKRGGVSDGRWLWPHVGRILAECQPDWFFLENVDGLRSSSGGEAFGQILEGLARLWFDAEWTVLSAADVGATHRRKRVLLLAIRRGLADPDGDAGEVATPVRQDGANGGVASGASRNVADRDWRGPSAWPPTEHPGNSGTGQQSESRFGGEPLADGQGWTTGPSNDAQGRQPDAGRGDGPLADASGIAKRESLSEPAAEPRQDAREIPGGGGFDLSDWPTKWPPGYSDHAAWADILTRRPDLVPALPKALAEVHRVADGLAVGLEPAARYRPQRLGALGDAVVPAQAERAFLELWSRR